MRSSLTCVITLLGFTIVGCHSRVEQSVQVVYDSSTQSFSVESFIPSGGGTVEWSTTEGSPPFEILPLGDWPCTPKLQDGEAGKESITCRFPGLASGDWGRWAYKIGRRRDKNGGGGSQGPPMVVLVGHCKNCTTLKGGKQKGLHAGNVDGPYYVYCQGGQATVDTEPIQANADDAIVWWITGNNPTATLTFNPATSCAGSLSGASPSCIAQSSGTYTISGVPGCSGQSKAFALIVR